MVSFSSRERLLVLVLLIAVVAAWIIDEMKMHGAVTAANDRAVRGVKTTAQTTSPR
jgi:hypothetical protein